MSSEKTKFGHCHYLLRRKIMLIMENLAGSWTYLDIVFAIPLLWGAYKGYTKGLIIEAASLIALAIGAYGAYKFSDVTSAFLHDEMDMTSEYLPLISFAITFIGIVILIHFFAKLIDRLAKAVALGFVNRILGSVFRILKYAFIISVLLTILNRFDTDQKLISAEIKQKSVLYDPVEQLAPKVFPYLDLEAFSVKANEIEEELKENIPVV